MENTICSGCYPYPCHHQYLEARSSSSISGINSNTYFEEEEEEEEEEGSPTMNINVIKLDNLDDFSLPSYATTQSAGMDLLAALPVGENIILHPTQRALVPTGIAIELPDGFKAQIRLRSGLAIKHGVTVLNSPGTSDSDYRGEVGVILINFGSENFEIVRGMRIAQMVFAKLSSLYRENTVYYSFNFLPVYVTCKFPKSRKQKKYIQRHAIQKLCRKFKISRGDISIHSIPDMNGVNMILPKKDMLPSVREYMLTSMYTQLRGVMTGGSDSVCRNIPNR
jgi:dUTP pyrophosphatase